MTRLNCYRISEQKAALYDRDNPDWVPTVNMGPPNMGLRQLTSPDIASDRFQRRKDRNKKLETAKTLLSFSQSTESAIDSMESNIKSTGKRHSMSDRDVQHSH